MAWGAQHVGGDSASVAALLAPGAADVDKGGNAGAACKTDGSEVTWGAGQGHGGESATVAALVTRF